METRHFTPSIKALRIGLLFAFCFSIILLYYVVSVTRQFRQNYKQPWYYYCYVGFELTPSYAISAFSCESGEVGSTVLIDGNEEYRSSMLHLSADPNYRVGVEEIMIFSSMFTRLDRASQERLQRYIPAATLAYPDLPTLVADNVENDIMRKAFAGVEKSSDLAYEQVLYGNEDNDIHAAQAILAGHGLGLCQPWEAEKDCNCEIGSARDVYFLAAYYSNGVEFILTEETTSVYDVQSHTYNNSSLGFQSKPTKELAIASYWNHLRDLLRTALRDHAGLKPRTLILYGDKCTDEDQVVVDEVLGEVLAPDRPQRLQDGVDPTFAGALGVAELGKRKPYGNELCMNH